MNKHLPLLIVLLGFGLVGCSKDLVDIANDGRLLKTSTIYDCRSKYPAVTRDGSEVLIHLIDISKKRHVFIRQYFSDNLFDDVFQYKFLPQDTQAHEIIFYELRDISDSQYFLKFSTINESGQEYKYVINKPKMTLSPQGSVALWSRDCRLI